MNYFDWFGLPGRALLDEAELRRRYIARSREVHPDFHTLADAEAREQALTQSTFNNQAYRALQQLGSRLRYLLETAGYWREGETPRLPPDFLMDMMDWSEEQEAGSLSPTELRQRLLDKEQSLRAEHNDLLQRFEAAQAPEADWLALRLFYAQWVYLRRLDERMSAEDNRL